MREAGGRAEDWDGKRPLSLDQVHYLLKLYAGWAGLREEEITCHVLRHTAAMRMKEAGETVEMIRTRLGRESVSKTRGYLKRLANQPKVRVEQVKMAYGKEGWVPDRGPGRAQPRNHLALKHGLTAKYLPEMEWLEEHGTRLEGLDAEIMRYRIVMLRAVMLSEEKKTLKEMGYLLNAAGVAAIRSAKLKQLKWKLRET